MASDNTVKAQAAPTVTVTFSSVIDNYDITGLIYTNTTYQAQITYAPSAGAKMTSVTLNVYENDGKNGIKAGAMPLAFKTYTVTSTPAVVPGGGTILAVVVKREDPLLGPKVRVSRNCVIQAVGTDDAGKTVSSKILTPTVAQ